MKAIHAAVLVNQSRLHFQGLLSDPGPQTLAVHDHPASGPLRDPVQQRTHRLRTQRHPRQRQHRRQDAVLHNHAGDIPAGHAFDGLRSDIVGVPRTRRTHDQQSRSLEPAEPLQFFHGQVHSLLHGRGGMQAHVHPDRLHRLTIQRADLVGGSAQAHEPAAVARQRGVVDLGSRTSRHKATRGGLNQGRVGPVAHRTQFRQPHFGTHRTHSRHARNRPQPDSSTPAGRVTAPAGGDTFACEHARLHEQPRKVPQDSAGHRTSSHRAGGVLRTGFPGGIRPPLRLDVHRGPPRPDSQSGRHHPRWQPDPRDGLGSGRGGAHTCARHKGLLQRAARDECGPQRLHGCCGHGQNCDTVHTRHCPQ